jgi:hypothetical protein
MVQPTPLLKNKPELSWFAERVERGQEGAFSEVVEMTPDLARRLLETNDGNRPLKQGLVDRIEHDIRSDQFQLNGEPIIVSIDGRLNDGQHRLLAIIAADKTVSVFVAFGVPRESRFTVDMGDVRTTSNLLSMQSVTHPTPASIVAKNLFAFRNAISHAQQKQGIGKQDVIGEFSRHRAAIEAAIESFSKDSFVRATRCLAPVAAAYVIISNTGVPTVDREAFFTKLVVGANLDPDSPILHLRGKLLERQDYEARRTEARLELILRYWNAWAANAPVSTIRMHGRFPKPARPGDR